MRQNQVDAGRAGNSVSAFVSQCGLYSCGGSASA
jgi:hypothetical protein